MSSGHFSARWGRQAQRTGNRNGGRRVDYENVYAAGTTPFSNECSRGVYVAATGFSGISRLILTRELILWLGCTAPCAAFPVPCSLLTVPFALPFAFLLTARYIRIHLNLAKNCIVLSCLGLLMMSSGLPCSTITPSSMKMMWSETSRAKAISWVTMIMVRSDDFRL